MLFIFSVREGKVFNNVTKEFIETPSILIDGDTVLGVGEFGYLIRKYKIFTLAFNGVSLGIRDIYLLPLLNRLDVDSICYVMNVALLYKTSGFARSLTGKYYSDDLYNWLEEDKKKRII